MKKANITTKVSCGFGGLNSMEARCIYCDATVSCNNYHRDDDREMALAEEYLHKTLRGKRCSWCSEIL